ncbi:MAG: alpha/beta hydrolase family protein [Pseudomonadota bacterium]
MLKKSLILSIFLGLLSIVQAQAADDYVGSWTGELQVNDALALPVVFHIEKNDGYSATMDSPAQGVEGLKSNVQVEQNGIELHIPASGIRYKATLHGSEQLQGVFYQGEKELPLTLRKSTDGEQSTAYNRPQTPTGPFPYQVEKVSFENPQADIRLAGTLTKPKGIEEAPVAILISGSGPQDRNSTVFGHKPFLVLADYLTRRGIAVLRFDDRGVGQSEGDFGKATTYDFAEDVEAAVAFAKERPDLQEDSIGLIGHSEGGMVASIVASKHNELAFVVLLATPGVPGYQMLAEQSYAIQVAMRGDSAEAAKERKLEHDLYKKVANGLNEEKIYAFYVEKMKEQPEKAKQESRKISSEWMRHFLAFEPSRYLSQAESPILALNGNKDIQVLAESNTTALKQLLSEHGHPSSEVRVFDGLNHLFQEAESGLPEEYGRIEQTMAPEVMAHMSQWIGERVK